MRRGAPGAVPPRESEPLHGGARNRENPGPMRGPGALRTSIREPAPRVGAGACLRAAEPMPALPAPVRRRTPGADFRLKLSAPADGPDTPVMALTPRVAAAVAGFAALLTQLPALAGPLVWDDVFLLRHTDLYTNPARLGEALASPLGKETFYWRPLATTSFLAESLVHGGAAAGYRATAALLFACTAAIAAWALGRMVRSPGAGMLAALVWALHPVHVETATWVSARFDLLAGLFAVTALAARGPAALAASVAAACLSKEAAFLLPALVPLYGAAETGPPPGGLRAALAGERRRTLAAASAFAAVAFARYEVLGFVVRTRAASVGDAGDLGGRLLLVGRSFATYVEALVAPWSGVGPAHAGPRPVPPDDARAVLGLVLLAAAVALTLWALRVRPRTGLLAAGFLVALLPVVQVVPLDVAGNVDAADRYLFLPSFFAAALVADLVVAACGSDASRSRRAAAAAAAVGAALAAGRVTLLPRWNDPVRFWQWTVAGAPAEPFFRVQLAAALLEADRLPEAEEAARAGQEFAPEVFAQVLRRRGKLDEALAVLDAALVRDPRGLRLLLARGELRAEAGDVPGAVGDFDAVTAAESQGSGPRLAPLSALALALGAEVLATVPERRADATARAERAERVAAPDDARAWAALARTWSLLGRAADAERAAARAEGRPPSRR